MGILPKQMKESLYLTKFIESSPDDDEINQQIDELIALSRRYIDFCDSLNRDQTEERAIVLRWIRVIFSNLREKIYIRSSNLPILLP